MLQIADKCNQQHQSLTGPVCRVLIEGTASHAVKLGSPSAADLEACAQLSPATAASPSAVQLQVAQLTTPQSKLRTQQLLHAQHAPSSPPPAAALGMPGTAVPCGVFQCMTNPSTEA